MIIIPVSVYKNYYDHKPWRSNDISSFEKFSVPSDSMLRHSRVANSRMSFSYRALKSLKITIIITEIQSFKIYMKFQCKSVNQSIER